MKLNNRERSISAISHKLYQRKTSIIGMVVVIIVKKSEMQNNHKDKDKDKDNWQQLHSRGAPVLVGSSKDPVGLRRQPGWSSAKLMSERFSEGGLQEHSKNSSSQPPPDGLHTLRGI